MHDGRSFEPTHRGTYHTVSRTRKRVCLEAGLKLDINRLLRSGVMPHAMGGEKAGSLRVRYPDFEQEIQFVSRQRHFGGRQFYFQCPATGRLASVLWKPPGAARFACRQAWGGQVAYQSQFSEETARCHLAKEKIRQRLCGPDWWDDMPPRPKRMRTATYTRWEARYELQEQKLDDALLLAWRTRWVFEGIGLANRFRLAS
jgi:hypothetical protein